MSKLISDEELARAIGERDATDLDSLFTGHVKEYRALIEAQRDSSDEEWIELIEKHRWQGHSPSQGFDPPKGYLIREDEWQALKSS